MFISLYELLNLAKHYFYLNHFHVILNIMKTELFLSILHAVCIQRRHVYKFNCFEFKSEVPGEGGS